MKKSVWIILLALLIIGAAIFATPKANYIVIDAADGDRMLVYDINRLESGGNMGSAAYCTTLGKEFHPGDRVYIRAERIAESAPAQLMGVSEIKLIKSGEPIFTTGDYIVGDDRMLFPADTKTLYYFGGISSGSVAGMYKPGDVLRIVHNGILESAPGQFGSIIGISHVESRGFDPGKQVIYGDGIASRLNTMEVTVTEEHDGWYMVSHDGNEYTIPQWDEIFKTGDKLTVTYSEGTREIDGYTVFTRFCRAEKSN